MKSKKNLMGLIFSVLLILVGNLFYALTVKLFLLSTNLMSGGTNGIAMIVNHLTGFSIPWFVLIFNSAMLLLGLFMLGKKYFMSTILSSVAYPLALELWNHILGDYRVTDNMLLNALFAGIGVGVALGVTIRAGASTGGLDTPLLILNRHFGISVSVGLYLFDIVILLSQIFYHPVEDLLYGIVLLFTISIVLDKVMHWGSTKTEIKIISAHSQQISEQILYELDRGVTMLRGEGGYLHNEMQIILSVVSNYELVKVERLVRRIDSEAFMIVSRVNEVRGRGFSKEKKYRSDKK